MYEFSNNSSKMGKAVRSVQELIEEGIEQLPDHYIVPGLNISPVIVDADDIPVVDLSKDMQQVVSCVGKACKDWGFFTVINHGISDALCSGVMAATRHFYNVPLAEKMQYFTSAFDARPMRYSTSFDSGSDQVLAWKDVLRLPADSIPESTLEWPSEKHFPRDAAAEYFKSIKDFGYKLLKAISLSLGLDADHLGKVLSSGNVSAGLNFYPPCPDPEHVYGVRPHSDPNAITMLLQDAVGGLQVLNKDKWMRVKPVTNSIIVNLGDQLEILSNGTYKGAVHRVIADRKKVRISIATFLGPSYDSKVDPIPELIAENGERRYNGMVFKEYLNSYIRRGLTNIENVRCKK